MSGRGRQNAEGAAVKRRRGISQEPRRSPERAFACWLTRAAVLPVAMTASLAIGIAIPTQPANAEALEPLRLVRTIPLPDLAGRIDHLAADVGGKRIFLAALEKNTIEVVDL